LRLWPRLETSAECEVQIHALYALLGLDSNQRGLRRVEREFTLCHEPKIRAAHFELRSNDLGGALIVGEGLRQDLFALPRREF
jgi:hypothetical protein